MNYFLNQSFAKLFSKTILLVAFMLLQNNVFAWNFIPSQHVQPMTINKLDGTVTFKMVVWNSVNNSTDDNNLRSMFVRVNGTPYLEIWSLSESASTTYDQTIALSGEPEETWRIRHTSLGVSTVTATLTKVGAFAYLEITFPLKDTEMYEQNLDLRLSTLKFDDDDPDYDAPYDAPTVAGWEYIQTGTLVASMDNCNQVTFNWNVLHGELPYLYMKVTELLSGVVYTLDQGIYSYTLPLANPTPDSVEYYVTVGYGQDLKHPDIEFAYGGPPSTGYGVTGFSATNHSCNSITLSWDNTGFPKTDHYEITDITTGDTYTVPKTQNSYLIPASVNLQDLVFEIRGVNECGFKSTALTATSTYEAMTPVVFLSTGAYGSGSSAFLSWYGGVNEESYKLVRTSTVGTETILLPKNTTSYLDNNTLPCVEYTYRLYSINLCNPTGIASPSAIFKHLPNLGYSFYYKDFRVSKGYFSDRVELAWTTVNSNLIENYTIKRKVLGSSDPFTQIVSQSSSSTYYVDNLTTSGVLYEYQIFGTRLCDGVIISSDTTTAVGFRSSYGTVTGQVNFSGGIAVDNVKITAESSSGALGKSIEFNGANNLTVPYKTNLNASNALTLEMWVKPTSNATDFNLIDKANQYSVKNIGTNYVFEVNSTTGNQSVLIDENLVALNAYSQLTCVLLNQKMYVYVNGAVVDSADFVNTLDNADTSDLVIGNNYIGLMDEVRVWTKGKTALEVSQDFSRKMSGSEVALVMYLNMDEAYGDYAYDVSFSGTNFNKNHAKFINGPTWSTDIPSAAQLSIAGYTNALGNYLMKVPYTGTGETFIFTPSYLTHAFNPSTRALFLGEGSFIHNNIDFEDISSFTIDGDLFYANTSCSVKDAVINIDGSPVIFGGLPLKTDANGAFSVQVPIGNHYISIEKEGHIMSSGRFPVTGLHNFQSNLSGIHFIDTTLVKVTGRVVGGLREARKIHGLGKSKNNIGQARIILKSQQGNGCFTDTIFTDNTTGEYTTYVPPMKLIPSVIVPSNPIINFGVLSLVDLSTVPDLTTEYDTTSFNATTSVYAIDSFSFGHKLDYIYRVDPKIVVKDYNDPTKDFIGMEELIYVTAANDTVTRNLRTNPLPWPVFDSKNNELYTCRVLVFELYNNLTSSVFDTVPTTSGNLSFNNEMIKAGVHGVKMDKVNTNIDTLADFNYGFKVSEANFNVNASIPEYNFTNKLDIYWTSSNGTIVRWLPNNYNEVASPTFATVHDNIFRAFVLGSRANGQQFVTAGPQLPEYVLRDPPGSDSYATREVGTEKTTENSWGTSFGTEGSSEQTVYLGAKFSVGIGVEVETEVEANITAGFTASASGGTSGSGSVTITNTQEWGTNPNGELPGRNSDLYIGKSKNVSFGISEELVLVPDSVCTSMECVGSPFSGYSFAKSYGLSVVPGGYSTQFLYDENHIKNYLIPNLQNLRNTMIQSNPKYTSVFTIGDDNYGLNNDDPKVDGSLPQLTSNQKMEYILKVKDSSYIDHGYTVMTSSTAQAALWDSIKEMNTSNFSDLSGLSYTYAAIDRTDSLTGDSVRWVNNQIMKWEEAIMMNEWEKVNISNTSLKLKLKKNALSVNYLKFKDYLIAQEIATAAAVGSGAVAVYALATPEPTGVVAGVIAFGTGAAASAKLAYLDEKLAEFSTTNGKIEAKFDETPANYSISGGSTFTSSLTHETATSTSRSIEYGMSTSLEAEISAKVNNTGLGVKKSLSMEFSSERDWSTETTSSETVAFTLDDPDQGDYFSVDAYPSILGWGPIFKLQPGGATSCPHEDAVLTEYYLDDSSHVNSNTNFPSFEISGRTLQREKVSMTVSPGILVNVPTDNQAVFNLTVTNESETNDDMTYKVELLATSNPFGAVVKIDGFQPFVDVTVPGGTSINKVLTVEKGGGPTYNYDSLMVLVHSNCQYEAGTSDGVDIVDTVFISAHFLPTCTDVAFASPNDLWVLNNSFMDTMQVGIIDYDINFFDLENIRLDYKLTSQSSWTGLSTFFKDTTNLGGALPISTTTAFTIWDWATDQLVDGDYDLRLVSHCTLADKISVTHTGVIDRINPHPFGTPSPADGILDPNDDIFIQFNEPIDIGSLTTQNFDVRGVINGADVRHSENINFNGVDNFVKVQGGANLQKRSFTLELWGKSNATGVDQVMISQGTDAFQSFSFGVDASDNLYFTMNNQTVVSSSALTTLNEWHHYAIVYDYDANTAELFVDGVLANLSVNTIVANYLGGGELYFGKKMPSNSAFFNGNIHEVRLWNKTRTTPEIVATFNKVLDRGQSGLLYNWKMNEAQGVTAFDHIRQRNATLDGASWQILPGGNAVEFDGVDDYLSIEAGTIPINEEMDFTLEFWFNSIQAGQSTLFSNGKGDGLAADSLNSWNIEKDAAGMIHVKHHGIDFIATNTNYFDGSWHHFSLVLNRTNNLTIYIDGEVENTTQALPYKSLSGPDFNLGARSYYVGTVSTQDLFFAGQMDEFRFWNTARKAEQIKRDFHNRMKGDEAGLKAFLPFESYQLVLGVPVLTPSTNDLSTIGATVVNNNGVTVITTTPTIRLPRPIQNVTYTYSVNNDKIIISPTVSPELIENVTLDITVSGVKDLHGNSMQSPKTWIAYINKNQVLWQDDQFNFTIQSDSTLTFVGTIVNSGGASKNYTIGGLPNWMSVSQSSGTVAPNNSVDVTFTIPAGMNVGLFNADVTLTTDFGFDEILQVTIEVLGENPNWTVNPSNFQYAMSVFGEIQIDNVISTNPNTTIAGFIDGVVVGVANLQYLAAYDRYEVFLDLYSNQSNGDSVKFKVYDATTGSVFVDVTPTLVFADNSIEGTVIAPVTFIASTVIDFEIPLNTGWTWISLPLSSSQLANTNSLMNTVNAQEGNIFSSVSSYDQYDSNLGWLGNITSTTNILNAVSYKVNISAMDTIHLIGTRLHPDSTDALITVNPGWNWIGYVSTKTLPIEEAMGNYNAQTGDVLKSQYGFAYYDNLIGWTGSLTHLIGGKGYMLYTLTSSTFTYPLTAFKSMSVGAEIDLFYNLDEGRYSKTMSLIVHGNLCESSLENNDAVLLCAFDESGNIRGYSKPVYNSVLNEYNFFLTVYSNTDDEVLNLRYVDNNTGEIVNTSTSINFEEDAIEGSPSNPVIAYVSTDDYCIFESVLSTSEEVSVMKSVQIFPNPFSSLVTVQLQSIEQEVELVVFDFLGRLVYSKSYFEVNQIELGSDVWGKTDSGVYTIQVISRDINEQISIVRLIK